MKDSEHATSGFSCHSSCTGWLRPDAEAWAWRRGRRRRSSKDTMWVRQGWANTMFHKHLPNYILILTTENHGTWPAVRIRLLWGWPRKRRFLHFPKEGVRKVSFIRSVIWSVWLNGSTCNPPGPPPALFDQVFVVLCIISCIVLVNMQCIRESVLPNEYYLFKGPVKHSIQWENRSAGHSKSDLKIVRNCKF